MAARQLLPPRLSHRAARRAPRVAAGLVLPVARCPTSRQRRLAAARGPLARSAFPPHKADANPERAFRSKLVSFEMMLSKTNEPAPSVEGAAACFGVLRGCAAR